MNKQNISSIHPATRIQCGMLFHNMAHPETGVYIPQHVIELIADIDVAIFGKAWQYVIDRHGVFRTLFINLDAEMPLQVELKQVPVPIEYKDWRAMEFVEQKNKLDDIRGEQWLTPFDIEKPPLMRLLLIQLEDRRFQFIWTYHHCILDGWSGSIVLKDFFTAYETLILGHSLNSSRAESYVNYMRWLKQQDYFVAQEYWQNLLKDYRGHGSFENAFSNGVSTLPAASHSTGRYDTSIIFPKTLSDVFRQIARCNQVTLNSLFQAVVGILLHRYTGDKDFVVGVTVSGRPADLANVESIVGQFINTVPLRIGVDSRKTIRDLLLDLHSQNSASNENSFVALVDIQNIARKSGIEKLFDTLIVFENYPISGVAHQTNEDVSVKHIFSVSQNNFPLSFVIVPGDEIDITLKYHPRHYTQEQVEGIAKQFLALANRIAQLGEDILAENTSQPVIQQLVFLADNEAAEASLKGELKTFQFSDFTQAFLEIATRCAISTALEYVEDSKLKKITYEELDVRTKKLAGFLLSENITIGDRVAICLPRSKEFIISIIACLRAGIAFVPIDVKNPSSRISRILSQSRVSAVISIGEFLDKVSETTEEISIFDWQSDADLMAQGDDSYIDPRIPGNLPAYIIYTSGSTGEPKGVVVHHSALMNYSSAINSRFDYPRDFVMSALSTVAADLAYTAIFGALTSGKAFRIIDEEKAFNPEALAQELQEHPIDSLKIVPSHLAALLSHQEPAALLPVRNIILGGEKLEAVLVNRIKSIRPDLEIINHYGPTETTVGVLTHRVDDALIGGSKMIKTHVLPIGTPLANIQTIILDDDLQQVVQGRKGYLYIAGASLATAYFSMPALTAEKFIPNPFTDIPGERLYATGDLAKINEHGNVEFFGRSDDQVKINGYRVELGEIKAILELCPLIHGIALAISDTSQLLAFIIGDETDLHAIKLFAQEHLPQYMQPQNWFVVDRFPLNANGKLDTKALKELGKGIGCAKEKVMPRNMLEQDIHDIWSAVLNTEEFGVEDSFFQVGGDSLSVIRMVSRLKKSGYPLEFRDIYEHPTIASQAAFFEKNKSCDTRAVEVFDTPGVSTCDESGTASSHEIVLTPTQYWFFSHSGRESPSWLKEVVFDFPMGLDVEVLREATHHLLARHEGLHCRFYMRDHQETPWAGEILPVNVDKVFSVIEAADTEIDNPEAFLKIRQKIKSSIGYDSGELFKIVAVVAGATNKNFVTHDKLYIVVHHLISDMFSLQIILDEFSEIYSKLHLDGKPPRFKPILSPNEIGRFWSDKTKTDAIFLEIKEWLRSFSWDRVSKVPREIFITGKNNTHNSVVCHHAVGDPIMSSRLIGCTKVNHVLTVPEILQLALANVICRWTGKDFIQMVTIDSGRGLCARYTGKDASSTVGWLSMGRICVVEKMNIQGGFDELLNACLKLKNVPHNGVIIRDKADYIDADDYVINDELIFNYKGMFNGGASGGQSDAFLYRDDLISNEDVGINESERETQLQFDFLIKNNVLEMFIMYSSNLHYPSTIERLAHEFMLVLGEIIPLVYPVAIPNDYAGADRSLASPSLEISD